LGHTKGEANFHPPPSTHRVGVHPRTVGETVGWAAWGGGARVGQRCQPSPGDSVSGEGGGGKGDGAQVTAVRGTVGAGAGPFFRARSGSPPHKTNFETEKRSWGTPRLLFFPSQFRSWERVTPPPLCWGGGGSFSREPCPFKRVSNRLRKFGGGPQVRKGPLAWCWLGYLIPSNGGVLSGLRKG